jgi:MFS superfamily sulfate permease-like transporter
VAKFLLAVTLINAASYVAYLGVACVITAAILVGFDRLVRRYPASLIGLVILGLTGAAFAAASAGGNHRRRVRRTH